MECSHSTCTTHHHNKVEEEGGEGRFQEGSIGKVPDQLEDSPTPIEPVDWERWFGPLVLTTFAVVGLAFGVYSGEILIPQLTDIGSRAAVAVSLFINASKKIFAFIQE